MFRSLASFLKSPIVRWVAGITFLISVLLIWRPAFTEFLELKLYDLKFRYRGPRPPGPDLAILAIDDDSLKVVGRWPWSRENFSRLLARVKEAGPKVVAIDVIFAERQETGGLKVLRELQQKAVRQGLGSPELLRLLKEEQRRVDVDRQLAQVVGEAPPTVLGFFFRGVGGKTRTLEARSLMEPTFVKASTYNLVRTLDTEASSVSLLEAEGVELNLPEITEAAPGSGYFNMQPDKDGTVRWFPMTIKMGPDFFAPLSLVSTRYFLGGPPLIITLSQLGVEEVRVGPKVVPVDQFGRLLINYLGPPGMIPTYSALALLEGRLPPEALKDKIVLVGATAVGIYDLRVTPFSGVSPGVEIQATVIDGLLRDNFLRVPPLALPLALAVVLALGVILGLVLPRLSAAWGFIFTWGVLGFFVGGNYFLFTRAGLQLDLFYPLGEIVLVYLGVTIQNFLAEEKERLRIRKAFESYVAPTVVHEMLKHPDRLRLGGERRELSILFSDIRGFTSLSEDLPPETLVALLHDFLNPMSEIIVRNQGTIDKYIGDAIMALFNAPLENPDHARLACRTALEMTGTLAALGKEWAAQGRPQIRIGIGINTGMAAVGNMGSDRLFDYTAIGDNVNLASRLEGLNKYYGTDILISEGTARGLNGDFILREVDLVRVKGKMQPLTIYELLGEGTPEPELARFLPVYQEGRRLFMDRRFQESAAAFARALELRPQDLPSRNYLEMSQKYQETPPPPDWQGVRVHEAK
jgi:adenylate cyclase